MNAIRNILTLQLGLFLSIGIGLASLFPKYLHLSVIALSLCLGYALLSLILLYRNPILRLGLRSTLYICTLLVGYILYALHLPKNIPDHIENHYNKEEKDLVYRSEEHTSELQSRGHLVCRLLLEKKKQYENKLKK